MPKIHVSELLDFLTEKTVILQECYLEFARLCGMYFVAGTKCKVELRKVLCSETIENPPGVEYLEFTMSTRQMLADPALGMVTHLKKYGFSVSIAEGKKITFSRKLIPSDLQKPTNRSDVVDETGLRPQTKNQSQ